MLRRILGVLIALSASYCGMSIKKITLLGIVWLVVLFVVIPTVFRYCTTLQRHMVFLPYVHWPKHIDFEHPDTEGVQGARNFYLETDRNVEVGVWHILPKYLIPQSQNKNRSWFEEKLNDGSPIVIYMHGNTGSRAREHRLMLYSILQDLNFHVVAFDYRGYADSSPVVPTKTGVVRDAHKVYEYVRETAGPEAPVVVYGHSLGTAVSSQFLSDVCRRAAAAGGDASGSGLPRALVLESPFNNIQDEIKHHPMSFFWRKMPLFEWFFSGTLNKNDVGFMTDRRIVDIPLPILILHAKDDRVIPYHLGEKLYNVALAQRPPDAKPVSFVGFEEEENLGHTCIYTSNRIAKILNDFVLEHATS